MKKARRAGCSPGWTVLAAQSAESFDLDEVGVLRQLLYRLGRRQVDAQDAILKFGVDVLLADGVSHIEAAGTAAAEGLPAQVAAVLILLVPGVAAHGLDG